MSPTIPIATLSIISLKIWLRSNIDFNRQCKYQKSLATTIIEMVHFNNFSKHYLTALTDFGNNKEESEIISLLNALVFS